ncbi:SRPBCC family protein [Aestuariibius sp. HNIBRBA575]|uniref:SRPBCC family protein n=1 Tax=Aestuariibius sp. HNIBRBA575 TaxID=3233343 RepID=UPI0034A3FF6F
MEGAGTKSVDITTQIEISAPRGAVYDYAVDPDNAPEWYDNITSMDWVGPAKMSKSARMKFGAKFLGRALSYTYEVVDLVPGDRLVMRSSDGPFSMETSYKWETIGATKTRMSLRNRGEPTGFTRLFRPFLQGAMRRANQRDLEKLKTLVERRFASEKA